MSLPTPQVKLMSAVGCAATACSLWGVAYLLRLRKRRALAALGLVHTDPQWGMACRVIGGVPYPGFITVDAVESLQSEFVAAPGDVFVATSPKCGTTWMQQIVVLLLNGGKGPVDLASQAPWLEAAVSHSSQTHGALSLAQLCEPATERRVFKTHAPRDLFPCKELGAAKIVYVARNPKDACVSAFYHNRSIPSHEYDGPWDNFAELYLRGALEHGSWFDHHREWWLASREDDRILWVTYERLQQEPRRTIATVARFLDVEPTEALLDAVVAGSSFDSMKKSAVPRGTRKQVEGATHGHFREGKAFGWRAKFTAQQSAAFDDKLFRHMKGCAGLQLDLGQGQIFIAQEEPSPTVESPATQDTTQTRTPPNAKPNWYSFLAL